MYFIEAYWEHCQTSKMEHLAKIVNNFKELTLFAKSSTLDVWQGSEDASEQCNLFSIYYKVNISTGVKIIHFLNHKFHFQIKDICQS